MRIMRWWIWFALGYAARATQRLWWTPVGRAWQWLIRLIQSGGNSWNS